jgi:hypothetical protein
MTIPGADAIIEIAGGDMIQVIQRGGITYAKTACYRQEGGRPPRKCNDLDKI